MYERTGRGKRPYTRAVPVAFDTAGMEQYDEGTWFDPSTGDQVSLTYIDLVPDLPAPLDDLPLLRHRLAVETAEVGALIEAHVVFIDSVPTLFQVLKLPIPDQQTGQAFIAAFTVPKATCSVVLRIQCAEGQPTGVRESTVFTQVGDADFVRPHPYAPELTGRLPWHVGDSQQWDQQFPDHPLTRARTWAYQTISTARIEPEFARLPPFQPDAPPTASGSGAHPSGAAEPADSGHEPAHDSGNGFAGASESGYGRSIDDPSVLEPSVIEPSVVEPSVIEATTVNGRPVAGGWTVPTDDAEAAEVEPVRRAHLDPATAWQLPPEDPPLDPRMGAHEVMGTPSSHPMALPEPLDVPPGPTTWSATSSSPPGAASPAGDVFPAAATFGPTGATFGPTGAAPFPADWPSLGAGPELSPELMEAQTSQSITRPGAPQPEPVGSPPPHPAAPNYPAPPDYSPPPDYQAPPNHFVPSNQVRPPDNVVPANLSPPAHLAPPGHFAPPGNLAPPPPHGPMGWPQAAPPPSEPFAAPHLAAAGPPMAPPDYLPAPDVARPMVASPPAPAPNPASFASPFYAPNPTPVPNPAVANQAVPNPAYPGPPRQWVPGPTHPSGPVATGDVMHTVLIGLPIGGYVPLWHNKSVSYWRMSDPNAVRSRLGVGIESRTEIDNQRFREAGMFSPDRNVLLLMNRYRDGTGNLGGTSTQLIPATEEEAFRAVDDRAMSDFSSWIGEVVLAAGGRGEYVAIETGGWQVPVTPVVLIMLRTDGRAWHSVVETSPVPVGAQVWRDQQPVDGDTQLLASPATERTVRAAGLLTRFAVATWPMHPMQLGLSFGPNPTLGDVPTR